MKNHTFYIANRTYYSTKKLEDELKDIGSKACLCPIHYLATIRISGKDNINFLQGQLSCDVKTVHDNHGCYGAYCNAQGKTIATFILMKEKNDFLLTLPKDIAEKTIQKLKRYAMFQKVSIDFSTHQSIGFLGSNIDSKLKDIFTDIPHENCQTVHTSIGILYKINSQQYILLTHENAEIDTLVKRFSTSFTPCGDITWHFKNIKNKQVSIYPSTQEQQFPHRLELDEKKAININKGCYLGQEIIARMHFKGKNKYQLCLLESKKPYSISDKIQVDEKTIGEVLDLCPIDKTKQWLLASLLIQSLAKLNPTLQLID